MKGYFFRVNQHKILINNFEASKIVKSQKLKHFTLICILKTFQQVRRDGASQYPAGVLVF